jgi:O-antigen/teichoic acid export membrane protein
MHTILISWTHVSNVRYGCEEWARERSLRSTLSARIPLVATGAAIGIGLVVAEPLAIGRWFGVRGWEWWLLAAYALAVWMTAEAQATLQATDRLGLLAVLSPVAAILAVVGLLALYLGRAVSITTVVMCVAGSQVLVWGLLLSVVLARARLAWRPNASETRRHVKFAWPQIPGLGLGFVSDWGDHLILGGLTSVAEVGFFGVAYQVLQASLNVNNILGTIILPRLITQQIESPGAVKTYLTQIVPTLFALWVLAAFWAVALAPPLLLLLMGPRFAGALPFVLVLCVIIPSHVLTSLYTVLFSVQERLHRILLFSGILTTVNVVISLALVPTVGPVGAAIGSAASYAVGQALYVWDHHRVNAVPASGIWALLVVSLGVGLVQVGVGAALTPRLIWAITASVLVMALCRRTRLVDSAIVGQLFSGSFSQVGALIVAVLAPTSASLSVATEQRHDG